MVDSGTRSAAESITRTAWESYRSVLGDFAMVQEQNMKLAQYSTGVFLKGAEKQREVMRAILEEAFRVYTGLLRPRPLPAQRVWRQC